MVGLVGVVDMMPEEEGAEIDIAVEDTSVFEVAYTAEVTLVH